MTPKLIVTGLKQTIQGMRQIADRVPDTARGQMKRSADRIVKEAKINTPVDDGFLEDSIRIEKTYGYRGRLQIDIVAGGYTVFDYDGRQRNLDQYAWIIHEHYEQFRPGAKSLAKMAQYPGRVGSGFLTRAAEDEEKKLQSKMVTLLENVIREYLP